jgi:hypothetical protein
LYLAAAHLGELRMPPGSKTGLASEDLAALRQWIDDGLTWPTTVARKHTHWAFEPVRKATPPADPAGWSEHPVDRFIQAKMREKGLPVRPTAHPAQAGYFDLMDYRLHLKRSRLS